MSAAFYPIAALLIAAIAAQVWYARSILAAGVEVNRTTKTIWAVNILLLVVLLGFLVWYMLLGGGV